MYHYFRLKNFRILEDLELDDLRRVTLIGGRNGTGKTTVLEGLFIHCGGGNPKLVIKVDAMRGIASVSVNLADRRESLWDSVFRDFDNTRQIELVGRESGNGDRSITIRVVTDLDDLMKIPSFTNNGGGAQDDEAEDGPVSTYTPTQVLELVYQEKGRTSKALAIVDPSGHSTRPVVGPPPPFPAYFIPARQRLGLDEEAQTFDKVQRYGLVESLSEIVRLVCPTLERLMLGFPVDKPVIMADVGRPRPVPVALLGDGAGRLLSAAMRIITARDGVLLLDEFENGIHYSALKPVWAALAKLCREHNTQLIATTHSRECVLAAHAAFSEDDPYDLAYYRLDNRDGKIVSVRYDQESLEASLDLGLEIR